MKKRKIFHIIHIITTLEMGGAQRILCEIIKNNKKSNYKHTVISLTEEKGFSKELKNYVEKIYHLNGKNISSFPVLIIKSL